MTPEQKQQIQKIAEEHIRYAFPRIKAQTDAVGKDIKAYFFSLVDDFFAVADNAITSQDIANYDAESTLLDAIWSGECELYEGDYQKVDASSENWLDHQSLLYKEVYQLVEGMEDYDHYNKIRADFEECLINALKQCDSEGVFGNRTENGIWLFAFYSDDHDGNGESSVLYRSAQLLNDKKSFAEIVK